VTIILTFSIQKMTTGISRIYQILRPAPHSVILLTRHCVRCNRPKNYGLRLHEQRANLFRLQNIDRLYTKRYRLNIKENVDVIKADQDRDAHHR
jgi:hypothetical protein